MREILSDLQVGNSVAEYDEHLNAYFLKTQIFAEFIRGEHNLILGDKGSGKTAIFKYVSRNATAIPELENVDIVSAFNESGSPVYQKFASIKNPTEETLRPAWATYIFSLVANEIVNEWALESSPLRAFLEQNGLRQKENNLSALLQKALGTLGLELKGWSFFGFRIGRLSSRSRGEQTFEKISQEGWALIRECCKTKGRQIWVMFDRLDESFAGDPKLEVPALRALLRCYLDMNFIAPYVQVKIFARRDLYRRITESSFVNLSHAQAKSAILQWSDEDLYSLLIRRVRERQQLMALLKLDGRSSSETIFGKIFPDQVDAGARKPSTWKWMLSRTRDGQGRSSPRNLLDLVNQARQFQIKREERRRTVRRSGPLIEPDSLKDALAQLSEMRCNDTLFAESGDLAPVIKKFRRGKAEHIKASVSSIIGQKPPRLDETLSRLVDLGFLQEVGDKYKVPMLYRSGLEITQGKGFQEDDEN